MEILMVTRALGNDIINSYGEPQIEQRQSLSLSLSSYSHTSKPPKSLQQLGFTLTYNFRGFTRLCSELHGN